MAVDTAAAGGLRFASAQGRWVIAESKMVDLKRQNTTVMKVTEIDIRDDIPLEQFEERALERE